MPGATNKILRLGIGLSCLSQILGCAADSFHNVVQSAHVTAGDPPVVTNANLREDWGTTAIGLSGSYSGRHRLKTTSDTDGDQYDSYAAVPNNYEIDWNRQDFALSLRHTPNRIWDLFLDYNASFQLPYWSNVSTAGVGVTLPFPWLSIRVSPALSMASYRMDVTDSVYQKIDFGFGSPKDTAYVSRSAGIESEFFWTLGFTLWPSPTLIDWPFIPYVGYQNSERLSESFDESVQLLEYSDSRWLRGILLQSQKFVEAESFRVQSREIQPAAWRRLL